MTNFPGRVNSRFWPLRVPPVKVRVIFTDMDAGLLPLGVGEGAPGTARAVRVVRKQRCNNHANVLSCQDEVAACGLASPAKPQAGRRGRHMSCTTTTRRRRGAPRMRDNPAPGGGFSWQPHNNPFPNTSLTRT